MKKTIRKLKPIKFEKEEPDYNLLSDLVLDCVRRGCRLETTIKEVQSLGYDYPREDIRAYYDSYAKHLV